MIAVVWNAQNTGNYPDFNTSAFRPNKYPSSVSATWVCLYHLVQYKGWSACAVYQWWKYLIGTGSMNLAQLRRSIFISRTAIQENGNFFRSNFKTKWNQISDGFYICTKSWIWICASVPFDARQKPWNPTAYKQGAAWSKSNSITICQRPSAALWEPNQCLSISTWARSATKPTA